MKNKVVILTILISGILFSNPILAKEEIRELPPFSKISLKLDAKVYIEQDDEQKIRIIAEDETLEQLITEVKSRTLTIRFPTKNMFKNWNSGKVEIYITVPDIDALNVAGSGDFIIEELKSRILDLTVSGSGKIEIEELKSETVNVNLSGSGKIRVEEGDLIESLKIRTSGSGQFYAEEVEANKVDVVTSGSGSVYINSNGEIKARVSGSGKVVYSGNPAIDSSVSGSGGVRKK